MFVVVSGDLRADLTTTAYYETAVKGHYSDVQTLLDVVVKVVESNPDARLVDKRQASGAPTNDDVYQFITRVADHCDNLAEDDLDEVATCRAHLHRLRGATAPQDLFSEYTVKWVGELMRNWHQLPEFDPSEAREYPHVLPKPYVYFTPAKTERYVPRSERAIRENILTYTVRKEPKRDLSYTTSAPPPSFESSSLAIALTDFLVRRAGQELVYKLIQDTTDNIPESPDAADRNDPIHVLVPGTASFLRDADYSQISTLLPALRSVAAEDIQGIPARLAELVGLESPVRRTYLALESIRHGLVPIVALSRWSKAEAATACDLFDALGRVAAEWSNSAMPGDTRTIGGFSVIEALRFDVENAEPGPFISSLFDGESLACYAELIRQAAASRVGEADIGVNDGSWVGLVDVVEGILLRMAHIDQLVGAARGVLGAAGAYREPTNGGSDGGGTPSAPTVGEVVGSVVDLIGFVEVHFGNGGDSELALWMSVYRSAIDQRYTDTVSAALRYYYELTPTILATADSAEQRETVRAVTRLLTLGANLVEAKTSAEFQAALGASADPVGSYVAKRESGAHLTVGAYMGGVIGGELKLSDIKGSTRPYAGLALPVGIELSFGYSVSEEHESNCCSFGIFVSPIDLGTIASYRIEEWATDGEDVKVEYAQIGWRQLFSPSMYLVMGPFRDVPISLAAGIQYSPVARKGENDRSAVDVLRFSMMVAIDVTVLRL